MGGDTFDTHHVANMDARRHDGFGVERTQLHRAGDRRIERGRANPTLNAIEVIANALGVTVFEMFAAIAVRGD